MENDLTVAKNNLAGHSICLCKDKKLIFSDKKGISPMVGFLEDGVNLNGYSAADLIVGKAAALLFVKAGVKNVFAKVLSAGGKRVFEKYGIYFEFETLTENIINRSGTDICPMEKTVLNVEDPNKAFILLSEKLKLLKASNAKK